MALIDVIGTLAFLQFILYDPYFKLFAEGLAHYG